MKKILFLLLILSATGCCTQSTESENSDKTTTDTSTTEQPVTPTPSESEEEPVSIPSKMELNTFEELNYYLYTPSNPTENMPLILYLHGGTNKKSEVEALLTTDGFPKYLYEGYYQDLRAFVAVPKLESTYMGWADIYLQLKKLIQTISEANKIDTTKIALTGHSMGGTGTFQVQVKMPTVFAKIAPMSGSIDNTEKNLTALSKSKIWAFVGTDDTIVAPESSITIINALKEKNADAKLTQLEGADHFEVPGIAYKNEELIQWLITE